MPPYPILNALILIFLSYPLFTKQGFHDTAVTGTQDREIYTTAGLNPTPQCKQCLSTMLNIPTELIDNPGIAPEASLDLSTQLGIFLIYKPHITVHSNFYSSGHAPYCHVGFVLFFFC